MSLPTEPFHATAFETKQVREVAATSRVKVGAEDLTGIRVLHYSIPNVQEFGVGRIEDGATIDSDKWLLNRETVLISKLNPRKSTVCTSIPNGHTTVASTEFVPIATGNARDNSYLEYVLSSFEVTNFLSSMVSSVTRSHQRVQPGDITRMKIPWPRADIRRRIADYLDHETAEIDALLDQFAQLKGLLQERTAAWVEEQVWQVSTPGISMRRVIQAIDQGVSPLASSRPAGPQETGILKAGCTNDGVFNIEANKAFVSPDGIDSKVFVDPGDLIVTRASGSRRYVGSAAIVPQLDRTLAMSDKHYRIKTIDQYDEGFLSLAMQTGAYRAQLEPLISGAEGLAKNISIANLKNLDVPYVPLGHQREVVREAQVTVEAMRNTTQSVDLALELAKERRAALISAAVTGQIDVTEKHIPVAEELESALAEA